MKFEGTVGRWRQLAGALLAGALLLLSDPSLEAQRRVQRLSGQNVAPVYDRYEVNPDGTFSMWFGYFNRNHEEALEIPIGPDNRFEPGTADRGQPTHFVPQWQKSSFRVVVPKDFGQQKITWRLTAKGRTETVVAALDPRSIIDRQQTTLEGTVGLNKAPLVSIEPAAQTVARGAPAAIRRSNRRWPAGEYADRDGSSSGRQVPHDGDLQRARRVRDPRRRRRRFAAGWDLLLLGRP